MFLRIIKYVEKVEAGKNKSGDSVMFFKLQHVHQPVGSLIFISNVVPEKNKGSM